MRILVSMLGVSGHTSGSWTRAINLFPGLKNDFHHEVIVLTDDSVAAEEFGSLGIEVIHFRHCPWLLSLIVRGFRTRRATRSIHPDVICIEAFPVPRNLQVPTSLTIHDLRHFEPEAGSFLKKFDRCLRIRSLDRAWGVISVSEHTSRLLTKIVPIAATVVHNPIPAIPRVTAGLTSASNPNFGRKFALVLGHLEPRKNVELAIRAALCESWPTSVDLVIAGKDLGELGWLRSLAGQSEKIVFLGKVPEDTKVALFAAALVTLVPSRIEGFGLVAVEAISLGSPVLAARGTALEEVIGDPDSLLDPDSPEIWSEKVRQLYQNAEYRADVLKRQQEFTRIFDLRNCVRQLHTALMAIAERSIPRRD